MFQKKKSFIIQLKHYLEFIHELIEFISLENGCQQSINILSI